MDMNKFEELLEDYAGAVAETAVFNATQRSGMTVRMTRPRRQALLDFVKEHLQVEARALEMLNEREQEKPPAAAQGASDPTEREDYYEPRIAKTPLPTVPAPLSASGAKLDQSLSHEQYKAVRRAMHEYGFADSDCDAIMGDIHVRLRTYVTADPFAAAKPVSVEENKADSQDDWTPNTCAGFHGGFYALHRRVPTEQEVWDAGVKSGMSRNVPAQTFPYQKTFDAIAAATTIEGGRVAVSVRKFEEAFGAAITQGEPT